MIHSNTNIDSIYQTSPNGKDKGSTIKGFKNIGGLARYLTLSHIIAKIQFLVSANFSKFGTKFRNS